ncbi:ICP22 family protein [Nocardiopsis kunsanensis]|uniref:hypothetical protein n=1 Tax=Nocardiopsis kunsanensis TaxID=141693 RepID=UPI00034700CE|nr:hypothetical protein [Nocardiopsis kunsanensis]
MPDTGRAAHAPRVATAVHPVVAALLIPLLAFFFLTALWLLGSGPAHALDLDGGVEGSEAGGPAPGTEGSAGGTGSAETPEPDSDGAAEGRNTEAPLDTLVPSGVTGEVTVPVTDTLGSVHQRIGDPVSEPGGGLSGAGLPVAEIGEGARRAVEGLGREESVVPGSGLTSVITGEGSPAPDAASEDRAESAVRDHGTGDACDTERDHRASERTAPEDPGAAPRTATGTTTVPGGATDSGTDTVSKAGAGSDTGEPRLSHPASAPAVSAQTAGPAAPAVAGFLPSAPVTGPASTAVRPWSTAPHGVPAGPVEDPTVFPD